MHDENIKMSEKNVVIDIFESFCFEHEPRQRYCIIQTSTTRNYITTELNFKLMSTKRQAMASSRSTSINPRTANKNTYATTIEYLFLAETFACNDTQWESLHLFPWCARYESFPFWSAMQLPRTPNHKSGHPSDRHDRWHCLC